MIDAQSNPDSHAPSITINSNEAFFHPEEIETADGQTEPYLEATNHLGTIAARMNVSGQMMEIYRYLPYGERYAGSQTPHQYTGKERDAESGLDYFGARYYASVHGRWMSVDSSRGAITHPQSLNRYGFVLSNPVNFIDPAGAQATMWCEEIAGEQVCHISTPAQPPGPETTTATLPGNHNFFEGAQDVAQESGSERDHTPALQPFGPSVQGIPDCMQNALGVIFKGILGSKNPSLAYWGVDLSNVRIHPYGIPAAVTQAAWINPDAFTWGYDVFFRPGQFDPSSITVNDIAAMAHELTHTAQYLRIGAALRDGGGGGFGLLYLLGALYGRAVHSSDGTEAYLANPFEQEAYSVQARVLKVLQDPNGPFKGENPCAGN